MSIVNCLYIGIFDKVKFVFCTVLFYKENISRDIANRHTGVACKMYLCVWLVVVYVLT